jgi:hypothetical protein
VASYLTTCDAATNFRITAFSWRPRRKRLVQSFIPSSEREIKLQQWTQFPYQDIPESMYD